ncbi:phosphopantetheine-binding protein [Streptomyces sp. NPDC046985]|uniref:phosphopantetheine-binding protein n=1 Tax=Streptomyces sp. NPDC046985 TaxID=3155377 RepID=UPI003406000B
MTEATSAAEGGRTLDGAPEEVIAAVWAEELGLDSVDPDAGFFDLGADSAMVLHVVRVLRERWPRLGLVHVFAHPTVAQLAEFLGDA